MRKIGFIILSFIGLIVVWSLLNTTKANYPDAVLIYPKEGNENGWEIYRSDLFGNQNNRDKLFYKGIRITEEGPLRLTSGWFRGGDKKPLEEDLEGTPIEQTKPTIPFHLAGFLARVHGMGTVKLKGELSLYSNNGSGPNIPLEYKLSWFFTGDNIRERHAWIDATNGTLIYIEPYDNVVTGE